MTAFWVVAGIFIVIALLFVIPALLRNYAPGKENAERETANVNIYRDQMAELAEDLRNDILSREQYEASKEELQKRMLQDLSTEHPFVKTFAVKRHGITAAVITLLAVPLLAVYLYTVIGDARGLLSQSQLASATQFHSNDTEEIPDGHAQMKSVMENLIARLQDNPEDVEGWLMLARSYAIMGRFDEASSAYSKLVEMQPESPQFLSDYADVLAMTNEGSLIGKPAQLIDKALKINPDYPKALALAGTVEFEKKQYGAAAAFWERLLVLIPVESELAKSISESIVQAKSMADEDEEQSAPVQLAKNDSVGTDIAAAPVPDNASTKQPAASGVPSISGIVTLNPALAGKVSATDTLFVFARASVGPKMPLAILRAQVKDLPVVFTLDDGMAMTPAMKLSSFPEVVIGARISKTGQAVPASGDLEGYSQPVKVGDTDVAVTIDQQVP
ncbi:c-type cytochrome biogenesis protein CcmI [Nitrosomonas mobilis]|uniref:TPR repeat n=1 Tax=Nitrosomonas mobilis TaxID=51642 RepID=A0A1G5SBG2_9PROT|nr:c-type cytochrome biogenesis protein CcmI [Nitrosomonas mobilis]SCZ84544.1 TPR repeat [Nitrosomonas mobilis]HNO75520.1 c-type cytochrome biogenesis protein CcmI [Nitrosomonas mobilis]